MSTKSNTELRDKILALVPQTACEFGCDGNGTYSDTDMDGEQVAAQCEYCYVVRFPTVDALYQLVVESRIKGGMHEIAGVLSKNMDNGGIVRTNASNPRATTLNERYIELQSQLSSIGESK